MLLNTRHIISKFPAIALLLALVVSCSDIELGFTSYPDTGNTGNDISRIPNRSPRKVFICMALGYNNLSDYLEADIKEIESNPLPAGLWRDNVVLVFSHNTAKPRDYTTKTSPTLTRLYVDWDGNIAKDTLMVMDKNTISASAETIGTVLSYIKENFPAESYGMLMSSHGTGWVPADYCTNPDRYDKTNSDIWSSQRKKAHIPKPFLEDLRIDGGPAVKGIGVQNVSSSEIIEMNMTDLAAAIPMKMEYIIFDACFMGCVEVAYQFKDVCDRMVCSQTEILAEGMDYTTIISYLFKNEGPDLIGFCQNYYDFYDSKSGINRSATISLVDCTAMNPLAHTCRELFNTYRSAITRLENSNRIQKYYRVSDHQWFFDLADIIENCGATEQEMQSLDDALDECILYKAATDQFIGLPIKKHSGLSMYLPYESRTYLNSFYRTLEWNKATGLVQ